MKLNNDDVMINIFFDQSLEFKHTCLRKKKINKLNKKKK